MRKFFFGLGLVTAVLIIAGGIGLFFLSRNGAQLDTASKAYTEESVVAISANWNADELWTRASPHLRTIANANDVRALFDTARGVLGPLVEYRGSQGQAFMSVVNSQSSVSAKYVARGHFEKGDADFQIVLVKQSDRWMIEGFHINSPALMQRLVGVKS